MPALPLALEVAEAVDRARDESGSLDPKAKAREIARRHPQSGYREDALADAIEEECRSAGVKVRR